MRKNSFSLFIVPVYVKMVFVILFCLMALCGCGDGGAGIKSPVLPKEMPPENPPNIPIIPPGVNFNDTELGKRIRQDFSNYEVDRVGYAYPDITAENVKILDYYGTYNDSVVVWMGRSGPPVELPDVIIGETILPKAISPIMVWKEGRFYELHNAYNQGLLTMENLRSIAYYIWGEELNLENHAGLVHTSLSGIFFSYLFTYLQPYFPEAGFTDVQIENYYGSYKYIKTGAIDDISTTPSISNDHVAVMMSSKYDIYFDEHWEETVAGTLFQYSNGNRILLWKNNRDAGYAGVPGRFYELQEAYDLGFLTDDDIRSIAYYHETGKTISYITNDPMRRR